MINSPLSDELDVCGQKWPRPVGYMFYIKEKDLVQKRLAKSLNIVFFASILANLYQVCSNYAG